MATLTAPYTFNNGDVVTVARMNNHVNGATVTFTDADTDDSTLEVDSNQFRVKDAGITAVKLAAGVPVQVVEATPITAPVFIDTAITVGTGAMTISQGEQLWSQGITLQSASNRVEVSVVLNLAQAANASGALAVVGIFRTGTTNALATSLVSLPNSAYEQLAVRVIDASPGGTTPTYTVRAAYNSTNEKYYVSGSSAGGSLLGGALASTLTLTEIKA